MRHVLDPITYILVDREPVQHPNNDEWAYWMFGPDGQRNRRVASTEIGDVWISTIFGGLDRSHGRNERPLVFETMMFKGDKGGEEWLTATWAEAEAKHAEIVAMVRAQMQ